MTFERERYDEGKWPSKWETGGNWERIERASEREEAERGFTNFDSGGKLYFRSAGEK